MSVRIVTAPLLTLNTSLQLSVSKNVVTMKDLQAEVLYTDMAQRAKTSGLKERAPRFAEAFRGIRNKQQMLKTN